MVVPGNLWNDEVAMPCSKVYPAYSDLSWAVTHALCDDLYVQDLSFLR